MVARSSKKLDSIHEVLRRRILAREWVEGAKLPTEAELAAEFDCSMGTISKAVALLAHDGLVKRRTRSGTHVIWNPARGTSSQLDSFAFIYPSEQHEGIWRTVKGFQDAARETGRRVVTLMTGVDYKKEAEFIARLSEFDVRGAVVYPIIPTPQDQVHFSQLLVESKFPVVLAEVSLAGLGSSSVGIDGFHAGYTMTKYMIGRGRKRIGFLANFAWTPSIRDRYRGYRWALEEAGMSEPVGGVHLDSAMHPNFQDPLAEPTAMARAFLDRAGKLDSIVCADDFMALGCIAAAQERGWCVTSDLLVSGIGDYSALTASCAVPLTTYRIPFEEMGGRSFAMLDRILSAETSSPEECLIRGEIVVRQSA